MKKPFFPIFLFILLLYSCSENNQLRQATDFLTKSDTLLRSDKNKAKEYALKALNIALKANDTVIRAHSFQKLAASIRYTGNLDTLINYDSNAVLAVRQASDLSILS